MITGRFFILTILLLGWGAGVQAQPETSMLHWEGELTWHKHLIQHLHQQYDERAEEVSQAVSSEAGVRDYRETIRQNFEKISGHFPPVSPLNARVTGSLKGGGYQIQKVVYESFRNHHVTANLYRPEGEGPFPAILLFCGHEAEAKATASYQKMAILLAKHNFMVLVIDPISQAERYQLTDEQGKPATRGGTTEHTLLNASSNLVGTNVVNYEYWDNKRGLDYLKTLASVDTTRIGVVGNSGGGTMTTYFMSLNEEVDAAVAASWVTTRKRSMEILGPQDGCQWVPYEGQEHLEINDFMLMNAPTPTLILAGKYDFVDYVGTRNAVEEMKEFYATMGHPGQVELFSRSDGHGISKPKREAAVTWFNRWFYGDSGRVEEGELPIHTEEQLQVTQTGQVNSQFEDEYTIQQRNIELANQLKSDRQSFQQNHRTEAIQDKVKSLIGFEENLREVTTERVGTIRWNGHRLTKTILRREGEVSLPVIVLQPSKNEGTEKVQVRLSEGGKATIIDQRSEELVQALDAGETVIIADVRGTGELKDPEEFNGSKYYDSQYRNDQISLHIGQPVVGQRVQDIVTILDFIEGELSGKNEIKIHARGFTASPALHAAALASRIDQLFLSDTIQSYMEILEQPIRQNSYAYVVPNALKYYDLPDLVSMVNPQKVTYE